MLKVGLLGAGRIGQVHAVNIARHPGSTLAAVSDVHAPAAEALAATYGAEVRSSGDIIADSAIDAVLIATSTDTHSDLIEAATAAGKAVLCEKPVDLSLERARACLAAAEGGTVMIGFNRRFDASMAAMRTALAGGEVGTAELLSITSYDPAPPPVAYVKVSGGMFRDMTIHDFDMATFMMGEMPVTVSAAASSLVDPEIGAAGDFDTAVVTLTYGDGRLAVIRNSRRAAYGYDQRIELLGSAGALQVDNVTETKLVKSTVDGITGAKPTYFFLERYMPAYVAEWDAFVTAVTNGTAVPVTLADGVAALELAEAATRSAREGRPVALSEI
ncbi:inositol 2-dehydrogenase [Pelagovum pacificum]|uniref:Inositol 2-dehydrogenase n=1 Tax=Pelagovum pacificum TaxID=2588711 RepID=A0A5C5GGW8_9RHOB|nr:inositol 2-dehydrogenase [Pelagovum pacificum]QQA43577.1 inositol 2-dehydrogenase [Pelagovum pacificum]TNY33287.1 inositol 2-dehydrogenase [Pelagovum pacificum]